MSACGGLGLCAWHGSAYADAAGVKKKHRAITGPSQGDARKRVRVFCVAPAVPALAWRRGTSACKARWWCGRHSNWICYRHAIAPAGPLIPVRSWLLSPPCSIFYELANPQPSARGIRGYVSSSLPRASVRLQAMVAAIVTAMVTCIIFYSAVGALGYIAWPTTVTGNILNTLPQGNVAVQVRSQHRC